MTAATAELLSIAPESAHGRRVLVADACATTQELLKLLLSQRGHQVDIATDGLQALEALSARDYDVALLDFQMQHMDGLQVAAAVKNTSDRRTLPRLVAMTADVEGLLSHPDGCEIFDSIVRKPLDVAQVGRLVEEQAELGNEQRQAEQRKPGPAPAPQMPAERITALPSSSYVEALGHQFLAWPDDIGADRLSARGMQATLGDARFDAILIKEPASMQDLASIWRRKALYALPVIDLTGTLGGKADLDGSKLNAQADQVAKLIQRFQDQRARLHHDILFSETLSEQLLGRAFVSDRPLAAAHDANSQALVSYNTILDGVAVAREAETLRAQGLFKREFFDRFHACPRCDSSRLHVREECTKCRSADLKEERFLHHFKCAHQRPESEFRHGDDLVCPKCHRELSHFGFDYDRPGSMVVCQSCSHAGSEPAIGFVCLDCGAHSDAQGSRTRDFHSYRLTAQGHGLAEFGRSYLGQARRTFRFAELPIELVVALNAAAERFNEEKIPFTLANVYYEHEREIIAEHGARQFAEARNLFVENMRAVLEKSDIVVKGQSYDLALMLDIDPQSAGSEFDQLREHAQATLRFDLGAKFQAFGAEDFF